MAKRPRVPDAMRPILAWRWFPHSVLFSLALVLRVTWVVGVKRVGFMWNDALMYHSNAVALNQGLGFRPPQGGPNAQWPPGYSLVLAGLYKVFGINPLVGEVFNAVIGAVTVVLLMLLVEKVIDRSAALVAGTILAVMPGPILWTDLLVTETFYTFMFVLFFLVLAYARPTGWWLVAIGVMIGLGGLVRGEALTWGLLPIVMFWPQMGRLELVKKTAAIAGVAILVLMPWTIRNAVQMDAFVPVATNASHTLWTGHNPTATGGQVYPPESYYDQFDQGAPQREMQSSRALRSEAIEFMFNNPLRELELIPLKLIHLNRGDSYALDWVNFAPEGPVVSQINVERIGVVADAAYFSLLAFTLLGVLVLGRRFWSLAVCRCVAASFLTALFLYGFLYYGNYRYRLPYEPLMIIVAATLISRIWSGRRDLMSSRQSLSEPLA